MYSNSNTFLIKSFLYKFFFILKAAADGWRISYVGGNKFCFYKHLNKICYKDAIENKLLNRNFIKNYKIKL